MTERKNIIKNLLEKPKQIISDINTHYQEQKAREVVWWNKYLTTPPAEGEPLIKRYERSVGIYGGFDKREYKWDEATGTWLETARYFESGSTQH